MNGGSHFYDAFECSDGEFVSIASIEPQFYAELCKLMGLEAEDFGEQMNPKRWPEQRAKIAALFRTKTRDEWCDVLQQSDACFAPVLRMAEAIEHPQNRVRKTFVEVDGVVQPAPAPRFSATPPEISRPPAQPGEYTDEILADFGFSSDEISALHESGAVAGQDA